MCHYPNAECVCMSFRRTAFTCSVMQSHVFDAAFHFCHSRYKIFFELRKKCLETLVPFLIHSQECSHIADPHFLLSFISRRMKTYTIPAIVTRVFCSFLLHLIPPPHTW